MEPETMTSKAVADHLGIDVRAVKQLERDGKIVAHQRGRGLWSTKYLTDSVLAYQQDAALGKLDSDPVPDSLVAAVADEPECPITNANECCGEPESCCGPYARLCEEPRAVTAALTEPEQEGPIRFGGGSFWLGPAVDVDPEIEAMDAIRAALETLDNEQRIRAVEWAIARFEIRRGASA